jgi:hypothetical protein
MPYGQALVDAFELIKNKGIAAWIVWNCEREIAKTAKLVTKNRPLAIYAKASQPIGKGRRKKRNINRLSGISERLTP